MPEEKRTQCHEQSAYIRRGHIPAWYREQAVKMPQQAALAEDVSDFYQEETLKQVMVNLPDETPEMMKAFHASVHMTLSVDLFQGLSRQAKITILTELTWRLEEGGEPLA